MNSRDVLTDAFSRVRDSLHQAVDGLNMAQLTHRPDQASNTIAWLAWHLSRVQDDHVAEVATTPQVWMSDGWVERFSLPFDPSEIGYGQKSDAVAEVRVSAELLVGYHDAVHDRTMAYIAALDDSELDRIVDTSWDPPVTLGQRLVSVVNDDLQHAGQAAYVRGLVERLPL
jgi:uncharacterized damage-inducible protein DinB